jgi:hypothetical protein
VHRQSSGHGLERDLDHDQASGNGGGLLAGREMAVGLDLHAMITRLDLEDERRRAALAVDGGRGALYLGGDHELGLVFDLHQGIAPGLEPPLALEPIAENLELGQAGGGIVAPAALRHLLDVLAVELDGQQQMRHVLVDEILQARCLGPGEDDGRQRQDLVRLFERLLGDQILSGVECLLAGAKEQLGLLTALGLGAASALARLGIGRLGAGHSQKADQRPHQRPSAARGTRHGVDPSAPAGFRLPRGRSGICTMTCALLPSV